ncbi:hypothetical protein B7H23_00505 [Notoacmeibacter marinus]|uniref:Uncharacterized protein n=1 Tax=Notoacmeibacter marinus TaxID=1876515 RepID=A0A231UZW8_9HYPH|nr:hypothetical protein B7H23_00505 [Notoacmeibacter marinus]
MKLLRPPQFDRRLDQSGTKAEAVCRCSPRFEAAFSVYFAKAATAIEAQTKRAAPSGAAHPIVQFVSLQ